ncbi:MAG: thrombospondin type 3 repeat-containing protein, partial [Bacteroidota bacterium]
TYNYPGGINRLFKVNDNVPAGLPNTDYEPPTVGGPNYGYDPSGRLVRDDNESITNIVWSSYNKVREVQKNNGAVKLQFVYDAQGNRVKKTVVNAGNPSQNQTSYYVHDAGGKVLAIYTKPCADPSGANPMGGGCVAPDGPADNDHDGIPNDQDNAPGRFNPEQRDSDGDGTPDALDADNDNDGTPDLGDPFPFSSVATPGDMDSDGIPDAVDPCPGVPGNGGADLDHDGIPDGCDGDRDGDGIPDPEDLCPFTYDPSNADANHNGVGDICECQSGEGPSCPVTLGEQFVYGNGVDGRILTVKANHPRDMVDHITDDLFTRALDQKEYELHDHLGNVRVRFGDMKISKTTAGLPPFKIDLKGYTNYYPFGMAEPNREYNMTNARYGYNGKEMDNEWNNKMGAAGNVGTGNSYDYGFRMDDPRLGRWISLDPSDAKYPGVSPYAFAMCNPIIYTDPDGRDVNWAVKFQKSKQFTPIIAALKHNDVFKAIFTRFLKNQDNVLVDLFHDPDPYLMAYSGGKANNSYHLNIAHNGYLSHGYLTIDPTLLAKIILHEGIHLRHMMADDEGKRVDYPVYLNHMMKQYREGVDADGNWKYEGDHATMAEGDINSFVKGMKQFDATQGSKHSEDWYNAMAWYGSLQRATDRWKNMDPVKQAKYNVIINNEENYMGYLETLAAYKFDKSKANESAMKSAKSNVDWKLFDKTRGGK